MTALTSRIKAAGGNIDRILRLARYPVTALRLEVSGADPDVLQVELAAAAFEHGVDVAVEERGILRHAQRLVVMDVDSTLIQGEVIEMLAEHAGCADEVAAVTESAMRGEIDFEESLRQRVARLEGVPASALDDVYAALEYTPGARTMVRSLKRLGYRFALVSGGFTQIIERIADDLGIDYWAANELEVVDGRLTGGVVGAVVDRAGKAEALRRFAAEARIGLKNTQRASGGARRRRHLAQRALPRRDHVPARHHARGGRGRRRGRGGADGPGGVAAGTLTGSTRRPPGGSRSSSSPGSATRRCR